MKYIYKNTDKKNLGLIHKEVEKSEMTNKSIQYCNWSESTKTLDIYFETELSQADKQILDNIVATTGDEIIEEYPSEIILQTSDRSKKYKIIINNEGQIDTQEYE